MKNKAYTNYTLDYNSFDITERADWELKELGIKGKVTDEIIEFFDKLKEYNISFFKMSLPSTVINYKTGEDNFVHTDIKGIVAKSRLLSDINFDELKNGTIFLYKIINVPIDDKLMIRYSKWDRDKKLILQKGALGYIPLSHNSLIEDVEREKTILEKKEPKEQYETLSNSINETLEGNNKDE